MPRTLVVTVSAFALFAGLASASEPAPLFEDSFAEATLSPAWKVSGKRNDQVAFKDGHVILTSEPAKEHNLTQIVHTDPAFFFLDSKSGIRIRASLVVTPETKESLARVLLSSVPGQALKGDAVALLVNGREEFRVQVIKGGQLVDKTPNWKQANAKITRVELDLGPAQYIARVWSEGSAVPQEIAGDHGLTPETWGIPAQTSLALGAWTASSDAPSGAVAAFDDIQVLPLK